MNEKIIEKTGQKRGAVYQSIVKGKEIEQSAESALIPLTGESKDMLALINRPQIGRTPVGYERAFLERYQPNVTSYLTDDEKKKLADMVKRQGKTRPPVPTQKTFYKDC